MVFIIGMTKDEGIMTAFSIYMRLLWIEGKPYTFEASLKRIIFSMFF